MAGLKGDVKQIASNLWRKTRQSVDKLAANIDERTEVAKLNGTISRLNKERGEIITEMGRKVYALHRRGAIRNKDLLTDCSRVDEIAVAVDQLQAQIEELRSREPKAPAPPEVVDDTPVEDLPPSAEELVAEPVSEEPVPVAAAQPEEPVAAEPVAPAIDEEPPGDDEAEDNDEQ